MNTIGVKYLKGVIKDQHYESIIENILCLKDEDILKIEEFSSTRFLFQVNEVNYDYICKNHVCKFLTLDEDTIIMVEDISSYKTEIFVSNIKFDMTEKEVLIILENYGKIKNHYYRGKQSVKYFHGRGTERMTVIMELMSHIPSALYIKDTACDLLISYAGQPITCHRCGDLNHKIKSCPKQIGTGTNAYELDPEIVDKTESEIETDGKLPNEDSETEEQNNDDEQDEPTDIQIETPQAEESPSPPGPSPTLKSPTEKQETQEETAIQVSNSHKTRPECDNTPRQDKPLNVHLPIHTGEKPITHKDESLKDNTDKNATHTGGIPISSQIVNTKKEEKPAENLLLSNTDEHPCIICNLTFSNHDDLSQHSQAHLGIVPFKCSDCEYKNNKIEALTNHMAEKKHMMDTIPGTNGRKTRQTYAEKLQKPRRGRRK